MTTIEFSPEERESGQAALTTIEAARAAIMMDGFVVLKGVVDSEHIRILREKMLEDLPTWLARTDTPFNFNRANVQQDPPPFAPYLFFDVVFNPFAISVTKSILGDGMYLALYSGNTALPNTDSRQPVHADIGHLWPNQETATPPYALVVNIPLVDMGPWNGSTEIWPGTHLDTSIAMQKGDVKVAPEVLDRVCAETPPLQPEVAAGSILIRDIRMWHAGMPNPSDTPRPMLAMIHWISWFPAGEKLVVPAAERAFFESCPDLWVSADYVEGDVNYFERNAAYDVAPIR